MKEIITVNYISPESPSILLIADIGNTHADGQHLKHFKATHNIYSFIHNLSNHLEYYSNLRSKHYEIVNELNRHNLYKFTISSLSFGGLIAYYLIFHLNERIEKAYIHDYHYSTESLAYSEGMTVEFSKNNWTIPKKCKTPLLIQVHTGNFLTIKKIKLLKNQFSNISFIMVFTAHACFYKYKEKESFFDPEAPLEMLSKFFNGYSLDEFWNNLYPKWMNNQYKFKNKWSLLLFNYLFKRNYK